MKVDRKLISLPVFFIFLLLTTGVSAAEDANISFVGHLGGNIYTTIVAGNYAYVGEGQDLVILDITNTSNPREVGKVTTTSLVSDIAISGNYAYVIDTSTTADVSSLTIVDISNPSSPKEIGSYNLSDDFGISVTVSGNYAYLGCYYDLKIVDVSNPYSPKYVGSYSFNSQPHCTASDVAILGNYAYVNFGDYGLRIVDISNPALPTLAGMFNNISNPYHVAIAGNRTYVTCEHDGLVIFDTSNPSLPTFMGKYNPTDARPTGVAVSGNYAYIANANSGDNGLTVIDVTNVSSPKLVGKYATGYSTYVTLSGNNAYVVNSQSGLTIVDVADASSPKLLASYNPIGGARDVAVSGNYAYVADESNGLSVIDITDPSLPKFAGEYYNGGTTYAVAVSGNYAYLASGDDKLVIVDISNPSSPKFASSCNTGFSFYSTDITLANNYAYIAYNGGIAIVDISNPLSPRLIGQYRNANVFATGVVVEGNYAYVAVREGGFIILDITNSSTPTLIPLGSYSTGSTSLTDDIMVSGNYVYLAKGGLSIIDVSNRSAPVVVGKLAVSTQSINISGNYAYISGLFNGFYIVDIMNVSSPTIVAHHGTAGVSYNSYVKGNYVYEADAGNGLVILKTDIQNQVPEPPVVNFTSNVVEGHIPLSVQFTDLSENATNWEWQFGDGVIALGQKNPVHVYDYAGVYNVTLKVTNAAGSNTATKTDYINATVDENEVLISQLVSKVNKQIALMAATDPMKYYDAKGASAYMNTLGRLHKDEYDMYIRDVGTCRDAQSQMLQCALYYAEKGDTARVNKYLAAANCQGENALTSFQNANGLYISALTNGIYVAKEIRTYSWTALKAGIKVYSPGGAKVAEVLLTGFDYVVDSSINPDQANEDLASAFLFAAFNKIPFPEFGGKTLEDALNDREIMKETGDNLFPLIQKATNNYKDSRQIYEAFQYAMPGIAEDTAGLMWDGMKSAIDKGVNSNFSYQTIGIESPGELRVYDSQGRVTGLVNGKVIENIPYSVYDAENKTVVILGSNDTYIYNVVGTGTGEYGLRLLSVNDTTYNPIHLQNMVVPGEVHQYTVDWNNIETEKAITLNIDSNGDGTFDSSVKLQLPTASFADTHLTNQHINFDGSFSEGNIVSYKWDFGDGTSGDGKTVDHMYSAEGDYVVTLTVKNDNGGIDSRTRNIRIDLTSPTTAANISGTLGNNSWYTSDVQVNLTATDGNNGTGVNKTEYSFDNVSWNTYNDSFTIRDQGTTTLYYHSIDNAGNTELTNIEDLKLDFVVPKIQSATIFPANTTAGSQIDISANITDNIGVAEVTAGNVQLKNINGNWQGNITAPSSSGKYSLLVKANDAAGNTVNTSVPYNVVRRHGSVNIDILPTASKVVAGENTNLAIKVRNTQNIDDTFKVQISVNGLPAFYRAGTSWFSWTEKTVNLRAKKEVLIPIEVKVPSGTVTGLKVFRANVNSEKFSVRGSDNGYLVISRPSKNINKQIGPRGLWFSR